MLVPWKYYLKEDEQLLVESYTRRWVVNGPDSYWARPLIRVRRRRAVVLGPTEYLRVRDTLTGELRNILGPSLFFPTAHDEIVKSLEAVALKKQQYVRLIDSKTGAIRVERGEQVV